LCRDKQLIASLVAWTVVTLD